LADFDESENVKNVKKGDDFELLCPFENFEKIVWMKDGKAFPYPDKVLKKRNMDELSVGVFKCTVSNSIGNKSFEYQVNMLIAPTIAFTDPRTSQIEYSSFSHQEIEATVGESIELKCDSKGIPQPENRWLKFDEEISRNKLLKFDSLTTNKTAT
jgi:hypothetical protein